MIEFKQWDSYWNNFNNWDEALLSDSNRPRDEFGLKIQPWKQTDKWKWRDTNKDIDLKQSIYASLAIIPTSWVWQYNSSFKESYNSQDLAFVDNFTPCFPQYNKHDRQWWANDLKVQKRWDSWVKLDEDWNIEFYLEWSYIIQAVCQFIFPDWYDTSTSYLVKEYVVLKEFHKDENAFVQSAKNQWRWCWTDDVVTVNHITWADKWDKMTMWVWHTYWQDVMCRTAMNIYRIS